MIEDVVTAGGEALGFDLPLYVEPGRVSVGPGRVRLLGEDYELAEYVLELAATDQAQSVTLVLVRNGVGLAIFAHVERADHVILDDDDDGPPAVAVVATLSYAADADTPLRVQRTVVTPGPPHKFSPRGLGAASIPVHRVPPDTEERTKRRARAREFQARRANPMRERDLKPEDIQVLTVLLARHFGLVTD